MTDLIKHKAVDMKQVVNRINIVKSPLCFDHI